MIHIMMDINEHQDQIYTWGDNNGRDLYLLGVNVLVSFQPEIKRARESEKKQERERENLSLASYNS